MKLLALEIDIPGRKADPKALLAEARRVWQLLQEDTIREIYFRADRPAAVLVLECGSVAEAEEILATLPLVQAGAVSFELIPLRPYPGLARLFDELQTR